MIVELSDSADRLAQSEREGAWRDGQTSSS